MTLYVWIALGAALVAVVVTAVRTATTGLRAWRDVRRFNSRFGDGMSDVERRLAAMETRLAQVDKRTAELNRANAHLQGSLADFRVLTAAFGEFRALLALIPR